MSHVLGMNLKAIFSHELRDSIWASASAATSHAVRDTGFDTIFIGVCNTVGDAYYMANTSSINNVVYRFIADNHEPDTKKSF